jgi:tetratricopeptide (TPR) repeat protein
MTAPSNFQTPRIPFRFFTLEPSNSGGRTARTGLEFQDQFTAYALVGFLAGKEDFLAGRIEGVEDFEALIRTESGWVERYYQIKSKHEGLGNWTIHALNREGVWTRFFSLYRQFMERQVEITKRIELLLVVDGDFSSEVIELRDKGRDAPEAKEKLLALLSSQAAAGTQDPAGVPTEALTGVFIDGFLSSLRFVSRAANLRESAISRIVESGDVSIEEAQLAIDRLLNAIKCESLLPQSSLLTIETVRAWLEIPGRPMLQRKPVRDPYEVDREDLLGKVVAQLENSSGFLFHGLPKVGKSHLASALIDLMRKNSDYFWFTFSGSPGDEEKFLFQLATWVGQRSSVWGPRDDVVAGRLQTVQSLERLTNVMVGDVCVVVDDCHRANDKAFLATVATAVGRGWKDAKLIFISEEKLADICASGVEDITVGGLEPKEAILYLTRLGVDVRDAALELGLLSIQAAGHPVLLRAIADELPSRPSPSDVTRLSANLHSALSIEPFLQVLSEKLMRSFQTDSHREWLRRLAVVTFPFRYGLALELAQISPRVNVTKADWHYFAGQILDQTGADQFVVPQLLRPLLASGSQKPDDKSILLTSARYVFRTAGAANRIDFWDFHGAILALIVAERYEEAAMRFSLTLASTLPRGTFLPFEILFMVLNGDLIQAKLADPFARFLLLTAEIHMRLQDETKLDYSRIVGLIRSVRSLPREKMTRAAFLQIRMNLHSVISMVHVRRLHDKGVYSSKEGRRAFAPLQAALRLAVGQKNQDFVDLALGLYRGIYHLEKQPDLELLSAAIFAIPANASTISGDALAGIYTQYVIARQYDDTARKLCERHSAAYLAAGRGSAFFACEHAIATILHDRFSRYREAREHVLAASMRAAAIGASSDVVARTELLVADSYWSEKDYENSVVYYERVLSASFTDELLNQWVRERLADCLIALRRFEEAIIHLLSTLRKARSTLHPDQSGRLYARLVYSCALVGQIFKAAIACQGLCRIARRAGSIEIDMMSATLADWLLQYFEYSDPIIPKSSAKIRDSSALSDKISEEEVRVWNERGHLFVRASLLLGAVFEMLGKLGRSAASYAKAREILQTTGPASQASGVGLFLTARISRVEIRRGAFARAAASFARAVEEISFAKRAETPGADLGSAAFALFGFLEPALASSSDTELIQFFVALETQFIGAPEVRAWLLLKESELLFDRFLVQKGKLTLLGAESLALAHTQGDLLVLIRYKKLFGRFQEMYANQISWLNDALEAGLMLASDHSFAGHRESFGKNIFIIARQLSTGPMQTVSTKISGYGERWTENPFIFSLLGLWITARELRTEKTDLLPIENYLRSIGAPLIEDDFR